MRYVALVLTLFVGLYSCQTTYTIDYPDMELAGIRAARSGQTEIVLQPRQAETYDLILPGGGGVIRNAVIFKQKKVKETLFRNPGLSFPEIAFWEPFVAVPARPTASNGFSDTVLLKSGETLTNVKATVTRDSVIVVDASGNTRVLSKDQVAGVKTGASTSPNAGFSDTVMLKSGETLTNVKATVTRDSVIVNDANGNSRTIPKEQVAGVKTGGM